MVDIGDLKSLGLSAVPVQVRPRVPWAGPALTAQRPLVTRPQAPRLMGTNMSHPVIELPNLKGDPAVISIIAPMKNEAENIPTLVTEIAAAMASLGAFELILVDDGSDDNTTNVIKNLMENNPWLRLVQHSQSAGQSAAVHSGVLAARGFLCATLDGDGQNPPDQLPLLLAPFAQNDPALGLVAGQRVGRQDTAAKKWASRFANTLRQRILQDATRDTGCGLKAFRRDAFLSMPFFNHMHRYLPAIFARQGWRIAHVDVTHRERGAGRSKYTNFGRAIVGIYDLIGVAWLIKRAKTARPSEAQNG
jgi:dolichol-phosphate mannosyltransferase